MVMGSLRQDSEVVVIGAGPGGYVAALRAADLGKEVTLVEARKQRGGVCLIEGCIPSKALINSMEIVEAAKDAKKMGITIGDVDIDLDKLRKFKESVVTGLTKGVDGLLAKRGVQVVEGRARFESSTSLAIEGGDVTGIDFKQCILATGSRVAELPVGKDLDLWSSTEALDIPSIPKRLVVVGGGYIGLELGFVYAGLGSKVTVVEFLPHLLNGADRDLVDVVKKRCDKRFEAVMLESKVSNIEKKGKAYTVTVETKKGEETIEADQVLVAIGRKPNLEEIGLENTKVKIGDDGLVEIDETCRTADPTIFAIGDITPGPMLAHKASRQGKVAAEVIAGEPSAFDNRVVPAVVFTDPELAWAGMTEAEAKEQGREVKVGKFPMAALGRAKSIGRTEGMVKIIADPESDLVLGVGIVAPHASDLISEAALAIEMGATLEDIAATIHPHPTLGESIMEAAEVAMGTVVHINPPKAAKTREEAGAKA
jgi:dihydrolipoamide dehydrogenase